MYNPGTRPFTVAKKVRTSQTNRLNDLRLLLSFVSLRCAKSANRGVRGDCSRRTECVPPNESCVGNTDIRHTNISLQTDNLA